MNKLYFKFGAMGSSKSAQALITEFNYRQRGYNVLMLKPSVDTRDGHGLIASRIGIKSPCTLFSKNENLFNLVKAQKGVQVAIVDEAQFCTKEQIDQLHDLTENGVVVLCYGLKTNFKGELFEGSKRLIEIAESLQEIKSVCRCGAKATMNARGINGRVATEGDEILIGGDEAYEAMCYTCFKKYQHQPLPKSKNDLEQE